MSDFNKTMGLKEKAEEDIYFAKRNRELIRALHEEDSRESLGPDAADTASEIDESGNKDDTLAAGRPHSPGKRAKHLRALFHKIFRLSPDKFL